ncbi:U-box domain-containing protein 62 [Turnera subulata]|uniref:U-box domain-containing protein 62 n=1 Tax=Turnera subulata TaxID=218843 RepID=A0A9Q0J0C4_9ROSI|nr:U-box domain-containing protein 62 [Turnera subulata]
MWEALRAAVQAFYREEDAQFCRQSKRKREKFDQEKGNYGDATVMDGHRTRGVQFPFAVTDRVIIKGNKRTPQRFVGREAVVTTQCLNGWYVVKTLDNAESVKLQYRSLAKVPDDLSSKAMPSKMAPNWL